MDDVKDRVKGFMKKVNNPFSSSSSSSKFKGQGRVLGSYSSSSLSSNSISISKPISSPTNSKPLLQKTINSDHNRIHKPKKSDLDRKPGNGFDPFDSLVTTGKRSQNGYSLNVYECTVCGKSFRYEEEVSEHVDSCLSNRIESNDANIVVSDKNNEEVEWSNGELEVCVECEFRRIRISNPRIKEVFGEVMGGVELLSFVGFKITEENGETWAVMEVRTEEQIKLIKKSTLLLESQLVHVQEPSKRENLVLATSAEIDANTAKLKQVDRQVVIIADILEIHLIFH
ncbi:putative transcription factor C2H2 family [Lupinus albus]|uniref:Putative transcription factor C2H2 family n=1 Tax=Lupinus albus TaxID=3870 RepID=A0A6A4NV77_LUPAL|nr:putative transcription factor C2H2 family [Lupinus albus]